MWRMTFSKSLTRSALFVAISVFCGATPPAVGQVLDINLWPDGLVKYRYCQDDPTCSPSLDLTGREPSPTGQGTGEKGDLRAMMTRWESALELPSPANGRLLKYVRFERCTNDCPDSHVLVRYTNAVETGNMCSYDRTSGTGEKVGRNPSGQTVLHLRQDSRQPPRVMLHELGHCLGLWHEFNRRDADRWLWEVPDLDGAEFEDAFHTRVGLMPVLDRYDYDSIMHYSRLPDRRALFGDYFGNILDKSAQGPVLSERDKSRVLQYYASERHSSWGFFAPIRHEPQDPDALPNPYLADGIEAVGTPAVAHQSPGNYDIFARGSNGHIYWKLFRQVGNVPFTFAGWRSIGCCFRSDPSAVSRSVDRIDVVAVSAGGDLRRIKYIEGTWSAPLTIRGGHPVAGIKNAGEGYIGPAVASRGADLLDVFVVDGDGLLAVTTWSSANWGQWHTLGAGYDVTARPAAVALSATDVRLAINVRNVHLYEPLVTFSSPVPLFDLGDATATTASQTAPTLTTRNGQVDRYRVLIVNSRGRISHRLASGSWRDIGGIPLGRTGISAVATGDFTFMAIMNGEEATGCDLSCSTVPFETLTPGGHAIQAGGLWIRHFN